MGMWYPLVVRGDVVRLPLWCGVVVVVVVVVVVCFASPPLL